MFSPRRDKNVCVPVMDFCMDGTYGVGPCDTGHKKNQGRTANNTYAQIMYILGAVMRQLIRYSISAMRVKLLTCQYILSPGDHGKVFFGRSP